MNEMFFQHNNNDSDKNEDTNSLNESVSSIKYEVNINNDIIKDLKKIHQKCTHMPIVKQR